MTFFKKTGEYPAYRKNRVILLSAFFFCLLPKGMQGIYKNRILNHTPQRAPFIMCEFLKRNFNSVGFFHTLLFSASFFNFFIFRLKTIRRLLFQNTLSFFRLAGCRYTSKIIAFLLM